MCSLPEFRQDRELHTLHSLGLPSTFSCLQKSRKTLLHSPDCHGQLQSKIDYGCCRNRVKHLAAIAVLVPATLYCTSVYCTETAVLSPLSLLI